MIRALRRKFILTTMVLLFAVFAVMLTVLNLIVRESRMQTAFAEMYSLSAAARVPRFKLRDEPPEDAQAPANVPVPAPEPSPAVSTNAPRRRSWTDDMAFKEMYAVMVDETGTVINRARMFDFGLEENELTALTSEALENRRETGRIGSFLFLKDKKSYGTMIILRNYSEDIAAGRQMLMSSVLIGLAALAVLFAITCMLARKVTRPAELAFKQQKQFIADASHELKTPLSALSINAEVLKGDIGPNRWLENIITECKQMEELVLSLLTLARLDAGEKQNADREKVDLSLLCSETVLSFESIAYEKQISLSTGITNGIAVRGSRTELRKLLTILLDNALKYSDAQGEVTVSLQRSADKAVLSVSNTGPDIDPEALPHIFERFYRADSSRTGEKSFGLGLAIAEETVKRHNGKISVKSSGGTTVFTVIL